MLLNDVQTAIRDTVCAFGQDLIRSKSRDFEKAGSYPLELFGQLAELGFLGMTASAEYGGAEADYVSYAPALVEIAAADGALSTIVSIQNSLIVAPLPSAKFSTRRAEV